MEWQAFYYLEAQEEQIRRDEQAMAIIEGIAHAIGGDGELNLKELFPRYPFEEAEKTNSETSIESSRANVAKAFGAQPFGVEPL